VHIVFAASDAIELRVCSYPSEALEWLILRIRLAHVRHAGPPNSCILQRAASEGETQILFYRRATRV